MNDSQYICTEDDNDKRIDYVLENLVEKMGLRGRRRLCEQGLIYLNNKKAKASNRVRTNNIITIHNPNKTTLKESSPVSIVKENADYAAIYKPVQIHSEKLNGMLSNNVQDTLLELFAGKKTILLNRLDFATSGIIMLAFSRDAEEKWKFYQSKKNTKKIYIALVEGKLEHEINIDHSIILKNKHSVRVDKNISSTRHTKVYPLAHAKDKHDNDITLVSCIITQGARHQIRAHLASINYPLVNDIKYGAKKQYNRAELANLSMLHSPFIIYTPSHNPHISNNIKLLDSDTKKENTLLHDESGNIHTDNNKINTTTNPLNADNYRMNTDSNLINTHDNLVNSDNNPWETHKLNSSQKNNFNTTQNEEYFILHHIKIEFCLFEALCLPEFWQNIPSDIQEHILSHIE